MDSGHSYNWTQISAIQVGSEETEFWQYSQEYPLSQNGKRQMALSNVHGFSLPVRPPLLLVTDITVCIFPHFYFFISTMCPRCVMVFPCNMNAFGCCRCFSEARKHILNFPPTDFNGIQGIRFLTILTELFLNRIETYLSKTNYNKKWYQISQLLHPNLRKIKLTAEIWIIPKCIETDYYTYTDTGILRSNFIWSCVYVGYLHLQ